MANTKPDHDHRPDHDNDNDNNNNNKQQGSAVASALAGGAMTSLAALGAALNAVDTASVIGRSGLPMLQFKREGGGTWMYGQRKTVVEDGSRWGVNPLSFQYGYICFGDGNKVLGERLVSVSQPMPDAAGLPDKGFPWVPQWCGNLKCLDGADAGLEVIYKPTSDGGVKSVAGLIDMIRERLNSGQHEGKVVPIVLLRKDSYPHQKHGQVWIPVLEIVDWMPLSGPAPAPAPASPPSSSPQPTQQPRRRRVG
jgi:hypothetical protein